MHHRVRLVGGEHLAHRTAVCDVGADQHGVPGLLQRFLRGCVVSSSTLAITWPVRRSRWRTTAAPMKPQLSVTSNFIPILFLLIGRRRPAMWRPRLATIPHRAAAADEDSADRMGMQRGLAEFSPRADAAEQRAGLAAGGPARRRRRAPGRSQRNFPGAGRSRPPSLPASVLDMSELPEPLES